MDQSYSLLAQYHNTPLLPQKFCIGIVFDFPWDIFISQEKLQTMIMQNLGVGGGGGLKTCVMGFVQVENWLILVLDPVN